MQNTGVLLGRRSTDYVGGEVGALPYEVRNPSGDWTQYAPPGERQWNWKADSMSCVSFSAINSIETQEKFLTGQQPNYSDRWIAKMSETMPQGNWLWKVADTIRAPGPNNPLGVGLVLDMDYPNPPEPWTFEQYHAEIPEPLKTQLKVKGAEWLARWEVKYEWVNITPDNLRHHLKHAPLQMVFPNHAVVGIYCESDIVKFFDTYEPYIKNKNVSEWTDALKIVLTPKKGLDSLKLVNDNGTYFIEGEKGKIGIADMPFLTALKTITDKEEVRPSVGQMTRVIESARNSFNIKEN